MNQYDLSTELETYKQHRDSLLCKEGDYVLIQGTKVIGTWNTYQDAVKEGYTKFGVDTPFMVKKIQASEQVHCFSRVAV